MMQMSHESAMVAMERADLHFVQDNSDSDRNACLDDSRIPKLDFLYKQALHMHEEQGCSGEREGPKRYCAFRA